MLVALLVAPNAFGALSSPLLTTFGQIGSGSGQLRLFGTESDRGSGIAADPVSGHLFIAENGNQRISEFTAWGEFVKAWGWGVADGMTTSLQTCTAACSKGMTGSGAGQFKGPNGIALSPSGDVYVYERENHRVQVFNQAGEFLRTFGGGVNHSSGEDICTQADLEGGDLCGAGAEGTGPSEFSVENQPGTAADYIDIATDGTVYVGDKGRIQSFEADGTFKSSFALPESGNPGSLAIDHSSGDIYFAFSHSFETAKTFRLAPAGGVVYELPTIAAEGLATDPAGTLFAAEDPDPFDGNGTAAGSLRLLEINPLGEVLDSCCISVEQRLPALATNVVTAGGGIDIYVLHSGTFTGPQYVEVRGPAPDLWPPPVVPPTIEAQFASSVGEDSATLAATINPNFWDDTRYYLEYGTAPCSGGGCTATPTPPGDLLGGGIVKKPVTTEAIELEGLQPATTYHYRFVAESGGGGPVLGLSGKGGAEAEGTFTTFAPPSPPDKECPNQDFREGTASEPLPDCRAYEMVSPVDKLGGDIFVQLNQFGFRARLNQSAAAGEAITYSSYRAFGESESAGYTMQYLGRRGSGGWASEALNPVREGGSPITLSGLDSQYQGFLDDLSSGWLLHDTEPVLAPGAVSGLADIYRRDNTTKAYEAVTTAPPLIEVDPKSYKPQVQGFSADGKRSFFMAQAKLTASASSNPIFQIYESFEGQLRLVSVRPNGAASIESASVGSIGGLSAGSQQARGANLETAISEDGSRVYWSEGFNGSGRLYVRANGTKTFNVSAANATFWAATPTGSKAIYVEGGQLQLFDLETKASTPLAGGVLGVVGASEDLTRVYFVSTEALGGGASAGQPNLYLWEEGEGSAFVATLSDGDLQGEPSVSPIALVPWMHAARVTPDGGAVVLMSRAALSGVDNADAASGEADAEVFRYDAESEELRCLSCSANGVRPTGEEYIVNVAHSNYWYASQIPGADFQLHAPRALSDDGNRVFFDSFNRLVAADTNERQDVYQWEAPGTGKCSEASPQFSAPAGGCVSLISSGQGSGHSEFIDASADGDDAFFTTAASLVAQDHDQVDLYDARVGGGFPPPAVPLECEGEACQPASPAPPAAPTSSEGFFPGNPTFKAPCKRGYVRRHGKCVRKPCKKGTVRRHGKCMKQHKKRHGKHRRANERGGRR